MYTHTYTYTYKICAQSKTGLRDIFLLQSRISINNYFSWHIFIGTLKEILTLIEKEMLILIERIDPISEYNDIIVI